MSNLLDRQLERELAPVRAPEGLWTRVEIGWETAGAIRQRRRVKWQFVAATALAACGLAAAVFAPSSTNYIAAEKRQARFAQPAAASESNFSCSLCHVD